MKVVDFRSLRKSEQETTIQTNAASRTWEIVTADPKIIRKTQRQGYKPDAGPNPWGYMSYTVPFAKVRIAKAEPAKRGKPFGGRVNLHVSETQSGVSIV